MTSDDNWKPCDSGTIKSVADQLKQADADERAVTRRAAFTVLGALGAGITYGMWPETVGPYNCHETMDAAKQYVLGQLSPKQMAAVDEHIEFCRSCADQIRKLRENRA